MTKRYRDSLIRVAFSLLDEGKVMFPDYHKDFERDKSRLISLVDNRGISVFTIDLPQLLKHFDKCLSEGVYVKSSLPCTRAKKACSPIPRLFSGMMIHIFDDRGMLRKNPNTDAIALLRQLYAFAKKLKIDCSKEKVYETLSEFYQVEKRLPRPRCNWDEINLRLCDRRELSLHGYRTYRGRTLTIPKNNERKPDFRLLDTCQTVFDIISSTLGDFDPLEWSPKHGPGAVSDLKRGKYKYNFPSWSDRLDRIFPVSAFAYANEGIWVDNIDAIHFKETSSKLCCVPKTQKGPRLIASEPVAHQWCQQTILNYFDTRCHQSWLRGFIKFHDQTFNQEGARRASLNGDWATIDLSMASDRLSTRLVESLFRTNESLLAALHSSRTRFLSQNIDKKLPEIHELKKFSTMGSACTFPVQTICFLGIALACVFYTRGLKPSLRNIKDVSGQVRVFGDDIIIPSDAVEQLEVLLPYLDFKINEAKSHKNGRFRESCGLEVYAGVDVTPAYYLREPESRKPETIVSAVESSNNFHMKGWWKAADTIKRTVTGCYVTPVSIRSGCFGWRTFSKGVPPLKQRWNPNLQRTEIRVGKLHCRQQRRAIEGISPLLQYFIEAPNPDNYVNWKSGVDGISRTKLVRGWEEVGRVFDETPVPNLLA